MAEISKLETYRDREAASKLRSTLVASLVLLEAA